MLSYFGVSSGKHEKHAEKHDMPGYASNFCIVYLNCRFSSNLTALNVKEAIIVSAVSPYSESVENLLDIMCRHVHDGPKKY